MPRQYRTDSRERLLAMSEDDFSHAVSKAYSWKRLRESLGNPTMKSIEDLITERSLSIAHFTGKCWNKGRRDLHQPASEILVRGKKQQACILRRALLEIGREYRCEGLNEYQRPCPIVDQWNGAKLNLQIDHFTGDSSDNRPSNLRFLCPNCHSQTATFGNNREGQEFRALLKKNGY